MLLLSLEKLDSRRGGKRGEVPFFTGGDTYFLISRVIAAERAAVNCIWELRARTPFPFPSMERRKPQDSSKLMLFVNASPADTDAII